MQFNAPSPRPEALILNAAKQARSARKFTLLRRQGETEPSAPGGAGSYVSREAPVASQITSHMFKVLHPPRGGAFDQFKLRTALA